jgi:glutaredoxin 3
MPRVEIYTIAGCGYCYRAKRLLDSKDIAYVEHDVTREPAARDRMRAGATGSTFPQIFIDGEGIGGCDELHDLDRSGDLDRKLAKPTKDD